MDEKKSSTVLTYEALTRIMKMKSAPAVPAKKPVPAGAKKKDSNFDVYLASLKSGAQGKTMLRDDFATLLTFGLEGEEWKEGLSALEDMFRTGADISERTKDLFLANRADCIAAIMTGIEEEEELIEEHLEETRESLLNADDELLRDMILKALATTNDSLLLSHQGPDPEGVPQGRIIGPLFPSAAVKTLLFRGEHELKKAKECEEGTPEHHLYMNRYGVLMTVAIHGILADQQPDKPEFFVIGENTTTHFSAGWKIWISFDDTEE